MRGYSLDLRKRIVAAVKRGERIKDVAARYEVSRWTVRDYMNLDKAGKLAGIKHPGRPALLQGEKLAVLERQVAEHPEWTLEKRAEVLAEATGVKLKKSAIGNYLKNLGITYKKSLSASEQDEEQRQNYWQEMATQAAEKLVFIDETSSYVGINCEYAWAGSHLRARDNQPKGKKQRVSLIAACSLQADLAEQALVMPEGVDQNAFLGYLEHCLLPTLKAGSILVLDNWTVHHGHEVRDLVEAAECELLYLPAYSPDGSPIEHLFAKIKTLVKQLRPNSVDDLIEAFCQAVCTVIPKDIRNAIAHCGYDGGDESWNC
ncbi:MAG: IS630 family transposase [Deinococcota bacterium]